MVHGKDRGQEQKMEMQEREKLNYYNDTQFNENVNYISCSSFSIRQNIFCMKRITNITFIKISISNITHISCVTLVHMDWMTVVK